jgi:hypothetical protein
MEQLRQRIMDSAAGEPDSELFTQAAATIFKEMMGLDGSEVKMEMLRSALSHSVSERLWPGIQSPVPDHQAVQMNTQPKESDQETDNDDPEAEDPAQLPGPAISGGARRRRKRRKRARPALAEDLGERSEVLGIFDAG